MNRYTPELGQAVFGTPWGEFECPELLIAALHYLDDHVMYQKGDGVGYQSPLSNNGARWANDTFSLRAYYWGEDEVEAAVPNFKCRDIEVRWYKWIGRGTTVNREVTPQEISDMLDRCLKSLESKAVPW